MMAEPDIFIAQDKQRIAQALEAWALAQMHERAELGIEGVFVTGTGETLDATYAMEDFFLMLYEVAPEAITRMLKAGAARYLK